MIDIDLSPERLYSSNHDEALHREKTPKRPERGDRPSWRMKVSMGPMLGRQMVSVTGLFVQIQQRIRLRS